MSAAVYFGPETVHDRRPFIVGLGGTLSDSSSSERALRHVLAVAAARGARTKLFSAQALDLPMYTIDRSQRSPAATALFGVGEECAGLRRGSSRS
jgi:FMN reductase